jgi:hypothetical protein
MLTKDISDRISQCLVHTICPEKIQVFGSYATGLANRQLPRLKSRGLKGESLEGLVDQWLISQLR